MSTSLEHLPAFEAAAMSCWNRIGVRGDSSCGELQQYTHCRNCPVYTAAAAQLLDADPPPDYLAHWTRQVAQPNNLAQQSTLSVLIFRVGAEWLALPTRVVAEIASTRPVHSIPQRRDGVVTGLTNVRGELLVCISLQSLVGVKAGATDKIDKHEIGTARLMVLRQDNTRVVCPVDEIHGINRYGLHELRSPPATVGESAACFTRAVLDWQQRTVGLLDDERMFNHITRSLA